MAGITSLGEPARQPIGQSRGADLRGGGLMVIGDTMGLEHALGEIKNGIGGRGEPSRGWPDRADDDLPAAMGGERHGGARHRREGDAGAVRLEREEPGTWVWPEATIRASVAPRLSSASRGVIT